MWAKTPSIPCRCASPSRAQPTRSICTRTRFAPRSTQILEQRADGKMYFVKPPAENTFRGTVEGQAGTLVAGGLMPEGPDEGMYATVIFPDETRYWIQPVSSWVRGVRSDLYAIYNGSWTAEGPWHCGNDNTPHQHDDDHPPMTNRGASLSTAQISA